jgi:hypothetical protein
MHLVPSTIENILNSLPNHLALFDAYIDVGFFFFNFF